MKMQKWNRDRTVCLNSIVCVESKSFFQGFDFIYRLHNTQIEISIRNMLLMLLKTNSDGIV